MRKLILILLVLSALSVLIGFMIIDRRVGRELYSRRPGIQAQIVSDMLRINPHQNISAQQLAKQLTSRRYREVPNSPQVPGEFSISQDTITILTREFTAVDGTLYPERRIELSAGKRRTEPLSFEPVLVSTLGQGDMRVEKYSSLDEYPDSLKRAVVGIEDERFLYHRGIDIEGIIRAIIANIKAGSLVQGGSTITQQLAKNVFFSPERSLSRKVLELFAALSLERRLSKEEILEMYFNEVYLGQEGAVAIHGFSEAANVFFGKKVADISLAEAALLAGIIKAPSYYSPRRHPERAKERRDTVLRKMRELRYISESELHEAQQTQVSVVPQRLYRRNAPHYVEALRQELGQSLSVEAAVRHGVTVYSSLDTDYQGCAEQALLAEIEALEQRFPRLKRTDSPLEAALVSIEPFSGKVRAWVGGRDFSQNQFDHVYQGKRQIGSTIKPFLYLTALDSGGNNGAPFTVLSVLSDRPIKLRLPTKQAWEPENYDREYYGDVTLRYALENSLNLATVSLEQAVGINHFVDTVTRFRLGETLPAVPALALGAADTTLLRLTSAYGAIANGGIYVTPRLYTAVIDDEQNVMATSAIEERRVADEDAVSVLTNILQGVVERGTARSIRALGYQLPVAGKTGTSNETRDAWFVGFTPDLVTGVWVGYDDNKKIGLTGATAAAPIWTAYMKCVASFHAPDAFLYSRGTAMVDVDLASEERATHACPADQVTREIFVRGTEPARLCRLHGGMEHEKPDGPLQEETPRPRRRQNFWERLFG